MTAKIVTVKTIPHFGIDSCITENISKGEICALLSGTTFYFYMTFKMLSQVNRGTSSMLSKDNGDTGLFL